MQLILVSLGLYRAPTPTDRAQLLTAWHLQALKSRDRHFRTAAGYERRNRWVGVPAVILSGIVGTSVIATLQQKDISVPIRVAVGLISVTAAVLTGVQTFLRYAERADKHRAVATKYKALVREFELLQSQPVEDQPALTKTLSALKDRFDTLESEAPIVSQRVWRLIEAEDDRKA